MNYERRRWSELPFGVKWRAGLVRLPRLVPKSVVRITSPEGPYPISIQLPSREEGRFIPTWLFLPPLSRVPDVTCTAIHIDNHGGGFIMGSCLEQAPFCAKVARERGCIVLCPDYCLAPLFSFPSALADTEDVICAALDTKRRTQAGQILHSAISKHYLPRSDDFRLASNRHAGDVLRVDPQRLSISGFSSGGNLALNAVLSTVNEDGTQWPCRIPKEHSIIPVILFYPQFDARLMPHERPVPPEVPRPGRFARSLSQALIPMYMPKELSSGPRASPGLADIEQIHPKARFFVVFSEFDTLREQSDAWVEKVHKAEKGGILTVFNAKGVSHGFANIPERFLSRKTRRIKQDAYEKMMEFWDAAVAESGNAQPLLNHADRTDC